MALPVALMALVIVTALTIAFASLATTEPAIARNHAMTAQARAVAESGIERAIWALNNNAVTWSASPPTADSPYNGSALMTVSSLGAFRVTLVNDSATERTVTAVGWAPNDTDPNRTPRKLQATLTTLRWPTVIPPCALCVMGTVQVAGNSDIDARANLCAGVNPNGGTMATGTTTVAGNGKVYGPGNDTPNETTDTPSSVPASNFDFKLTAEEFTLLRNLAKASGTYYQGSVTFNSSMPSGIVFVDTTTGQDITATTPSTEMGRASITGNLTWNGWLIVAGEVQVSGTVVLTGTLYSQNDFVFTGNGSIRGAVVTENRVDAVSTVVDSSVAGTASLLYDCPAAQTAGGTMTGNSWFVKAGTFREAEGY